MAHQTRALASLPGRLLGCNRPVRAEGAGDAKRKEGDKSSEGCHFDDFVRGMKSTDQSRIRDTGIFLFYLGDVVRNGRITTWFGSFDKKENTTRSFGATLLASTS